MISVEAPPKRRAWPCRRARARAPRAARRGGARSRRRVRRRTRPAFLDAAPCEPERLQRRCQLQRGCRFQSFRDSTRTRPVGCRSRFRPARYAARWPCVRRAVQLGGHGRVVIAVTRPDRVGLAGLAELFQRVLAHRLQHPVSRTAAAVFGDDKRLVDEQGELIEHLVALAHRHRRRRPAQRRGRTRPGTPPAAGTRHVRARSTARATNRPTPAASAGGAPRCAHRRSAGGIGRAGCRRSRSATAPARVPPQARSPAACRRGAGRSRSPRRRCRR